MRPRTNAGFRVWLGTVVAVLLAARVSAQPVAAPAATDVEVTYTHGPITLAGTLTIPRAAGRVPAVVLVTGSGAQTRDVDVAGFKVFAALADTFARLGVAVLRADDRGTGGSTGRVADTIPEDAAGDVEAAVALLRGRPEIDPARVGVCGHSEGASVAALAARRSADIAFVILLTGPALTGERIMLAQSEAMLVFRGVPASAVAASAAMQRRVFAAVRSGTVPALRVELRALGLQQIAAMPDAQRQAIGDPGTYIDSMLDRQLAPVSTPWFRAFLDYDPVPALAGVRCPLLAVFGGKDQQILPLDANRAALEGAVATRGNATVVVLPTANHLLQEANTGQPTEYPTLAKHFVPDLAPTLRAFLRNNRLVTP